MVAELTEQKEGKCFFFEFFLSFFCTFFFGAFVFSYTYTDAPRLNKDPAQPMHYADNAGMDD
jgi:hypothetical protein